MKDSENKTGELNYRIAEEYEYEITEISNQITELNQGRVYEISGIASDGYLATHTEKLERRILALLKKIQDGKAGVNNTLTEK